MTDVRSKRFLSIQFDVEEHVKPAVSVLCRAKLRNFPVYADERREVLSHCTLQGFLNHFRQPGQVEPIVLLKSMHTPASVSPRMAISGRGTFIEASF